MGPITLLPPDIADPYWRRTLRTLKNFGAEIPLKVLQGPASPQLRSPPLKRGGLQGDEAKAEVCRCWLRGETQVAIAARMGYSGPAQVNLAIAKFCRKFTSVTSWPYHGPSSNAVGFVEQGDERRAVVARALRAYIATK